ncbi:hypothetical protein J2Z31_001729 [Sinorhizobium kostiense]|uniref:Uncharacterized protein n=1 Tax=Sinorhizobium kostiense TaxID=76747 RepID=A0ABS4QX70_9HYPH|nr:hypothetical protein [Sinorhizobium kostiense]MBP2235237.1 hypothetical protein [Sinorhizobium kostiense]
MPRVRNPENEAQRSAQERYRERLRSQQRPEADAVDTALAAALAVYRHTAEQRGSEKDVRRSDGLEIMAINYLVSRGYAPTMAERQVRRRVRRLDVGDLVTMVSGASQPAFPSSSRKPS